MPRPFDLLSRVVFCFGFFISACAAPASDIKEPVGVSSPILTNTPLKIPSDTPHPVPASPTATAVLPHKMTFAAPLDGTDLDYEGGYIFRVNPVPEAVNYIWTFIQHGVVLGEKTGGVEVGIWPGDGLHEKFVTGPFTVQVKARVGGNWTPPTSIVLNLRPRQAQAAPSATAAQPACGVGWTRLGPNSRASVLPGDPNRVRKEPCKGDNVIGKLYAGTVVNIVEGPVCADGLVFWRIESAAIHGGVGWTAEGDGNVYWLAPVE